VDVHEFRRAVMDRTHTDDVVAADELIQATLLTLAERITHDEARDLQAQLPEPLQPLFASGGAERFGGEEFVRRVMVRSHVDAGHAGIRAAAVLSVLRDAVSAGEWADVLAQLPADPVDDLPGSVPASAAHRELAEALAARGARERWHETADRGVWRAASDDGLKHGLVRVVGRSFEARVYRYPTGPTGARPELSHGPQVFDTPDAALDYAEAEMGFDVSRPDAMR